MKVGVGSKNRTKVDAVAQVLSEYPLFDGTSVEGTDVKIEQFGHPKGIDAIVAGAVDRAKQAYVGNDYGFGLESGLLAVPQTKTGYLEAAICAIYDGKQIHIGMAPSFEWPKQVFELIVTKGYDGSSAVREAGLTAEEKIGANSGVISLLTKGRLNRTGQNRMAIMMALIHLENSEHY